MNVRLKSWLSKITPQDTVGMFVGFCGAAAAGVMWIYSFGISTADAANAEKEQDRRITQLEQTNSAILDEVKQSNRNLVKLMVATGVQPVGD